MTKILDLSAATCIAQSGRRKSLRIGLAKGVYDLFHSGHAHALLHAAEMSDILVVAVASDQVVVKKKGPNRPIIPFEDRAFIVSSLRYVDFVFENNLDSAEDLILAVHPTHFFASHDQGIPSEFWNKAHCTFCRQKRMGRFSTTDVIAKIRSFE